ncbi:MAG TPA: sigma-70 family RNA polymerase sigma factor [Rhodanobacteraceae bacterium]|jgi:RNA polymerase sigma-70 factor (ECF subfamily)|nr:sigma-70 family RNA polymerase sigma factor [Rhodanobacteraceae bacterium]
MTHMGRTSDEPDAAWMARLRVRDAGAFAQLIECYERPMFNVAYRMLGSSAEAADATQDVFLKVFENIAGYDPKYRLFSWIYRIAVNESIDRLKHRRHAQTVDVEEFPLASGERGPEQVAGDAQIHGLIQAALMELQYDHRAVIVLRHYADCSYAQMAEILRIPEKTVKSRLYSARQELHGKLFARGVATA